MRIIEYGWNTGIMRDITYATLKCGLWDVYNLYFAENWSCGNKIQLAFPKLLTHWGRETHTLRESIPRLFNWGLTAKTARCAPACSQFLPVKPQRSLGQRYWSVNAVTWPPKLELRRWRSSGPSSLMYTLVHYPSLVQIMACRLYGAKPLSEPRLEHCKLDLQEQISVKF